MKNCSRSNEISVGCLGTPFLSHSLLPIHSRREKGGKVPIIGSEKRRVEGHKGSKHWASKQKTASEQKNGDFPASVEVTLSRCQSKQ